LYFDTSTQYHLDCIIPKSDRQICGAGSVLMWLNTYCDGYLVHLIWDHMTAKAAALPGISNPIFYILTPLFNIAFTDIIAKWDCWISSAQSMVMIFMPYEEESTLHQKVSELYGMQSIDFEIQMRPQGFRYTTNSPLITELKPFPASFPTFSWCHLFWDRPTWKHVIELINWLHLLLVIKSNKQECQWNPSAAIPDYRYNNSNIRSVIYFKMTERWDVAM